MTAQPPDDLPTLAVGLTHLEAADPRTGALHRLALADLAGAEGRGYWIDARNAASTYALREAGGRRARAALRVARAFTAYQHHTLVREVATGGFEPALVVAPCLDALYADDDVPAHQAEALLDDVLDTLEALGAEAPVLVTTGGTALADRIAARADHAITARETDLGTAFEAEAFRTTAYRGPGFWQTTIPYWVDLLGRHDPDPLAAVERPVQAALG
ncbi:MAG: hypothetical protein ACLFMX_04080 [Halobacteriales archaeon]